MSKLKQSRKNFIVIYVRFFRHYRTKKLVYPIPPNTHFRFEIPVEKWKAYQKRKRLKAATKKTAA